MGSGARAAPWWLAWRNTMLALVFVAAPVFLLALAITPVLHAYAYDFRIFRHAGLDYLHGKSPYPPPKLVVLSRQHSFVYPAPMAALFVPFALLPVRVGAAIFGVAMAAAVFGTLRLLGVRDRRLYGFALVLYPVFSGIRLGTISPLLGLLVAALWRYRDRPRSAGLLLAALIVSKLFLAPLVVWLVVTRRWRAAVLGALVAVGTTAVAWAPIGFAGAAAYRHILSLLATGEASQSFSVVSLGLVSGLGNHASHLVAETVAAGIVAAAAAVGLAIRNPRGDFAAFLLVIAGALAASPIVWNHYFTLLLIPLAVVAPRMNWYWLLPLALWFVPAQSEHHLFPIAVAVVVPALVLCLAVRWTLHGRVPGLTALRVPTIG